jgi:hypothetical protein
MLIIAVDPEGTLIVNPLLLETSFPETLKTLTTGSVPVKVRPPY